MNLDEKIDNDANLELVCPYDHQKLSYKNTLFVCDKCKRHYPMLKSRVFNFLPDGLRQESGKSETKSVILNTGKWKPGLRHWKPGAIVNLFRLGSGNGRVTDKVNNLTLLDVGCGGDAQGDYNVDVYIPNPLPKNFFLASADLLPFKDNAFDVVRSAYVIEHNLYPTEMLKEHYRVSKKMVKTYTDNSDWFGLDVMRLFNTGSIFHDEHYFKWSKEYFSNLIDRLGYKGKVTLFNSSPSFFVKITSLFGRLPRIGVIFYRDLYVEINKK